MGRFLFLALFFSICRGSLVCSIHTQSLSGKEVNWGMLLMIVTVKGFWGLQQLKTDPDKMVLSLHVLGMINSPLCVALPHLPQGLVLVPPLLHILLVNFVHRGLSLK